MNNFKELSFRSSTHLQSQIAEAIRVYKKDNPLAQITILVDQPLQGFLLRRQLAETFAGAEVRALGNIQVLTLADLVEGFAFSLGIKTDPQPSTPVVEAALYALMAKSEDKDGKSNQSLATASAIARVSRTLELVGDDELKKVQKETFLNATQKDVFKYLLAARALFGDRLASHKLSNISEHGLPLEVAKQYGQIHSLVAALPKNMVTLLEVLGASGVDVTHWSPIKVEGILPSDLPVSKLISCPDPMTEVSVVVRSVMQDLTKYRADKIAVLVPSLSEYSSQIQSSLDTADIAWHGKGKFIGQRSTLFRTLQIMSESLAQRSESHSGFDRPKLMRLLQNGNLNVRGVNIETKYVRKWVRKNALYDDAAKWIQVLDNLATEAVHENDQISAEHLKHLVNYIASDLQALANSTSWSELGRGLLSLTESLHEGEVDLEDGSLEKKGWGSIRKLLLSELPLLDSIDFSTLADETDKQQTMGLPVKGNLVNLSRWIDTQLGSRRVTSGDWSRGIFVGTIESAKFLKFESVYVLGATEGLLPAVSKEDPFLPKKLLESIGEFNLAAKTPEDAAQQTLNLLTSVLVDSAKTTITRPRAGTSSKLDDVESRFLPDVMRGEEDRTKNGFLEVSSFLGSFRSDELSLPPVTSSDASISNPKVNEEDWLRFSRSMWAWRNPQFNEYFGNLSRLTPETKIWFPTELRPLSSSRIDTFLRCPYEFFALTVLGFNSNDKRDELKSFSPTAFGTFFHREMEMLIKSAKEQKVLPGAGEYWSKGVVEWFVKERLENKAALGAFISTGRGGWSTSFDLHLEKVIRGTKEFFATEPERLRGNPPLRIESAEHPFGKPGQKMQMVVKDDAGKDHWIVGQMDRLDLSQDGMAAGVMDFKTGGRDKQLKKLGIGKSNRQSTNVYTLQDVIYRRAVLSQYKDAVVKVNFVFIAEEGDEMYVNAKFADDPNELLPKKLGEITAAGESGIFVPQSKGSTFDHGYCRVCSSLGDVSDVVKAKYKKALDKTASNVNGFASEGVESDE
jgi:hypothetical protein